MNQHAYMQVYYGVAAVYVVAGLFMIALEVWAYRKTAHRGLLYMLAAQSFGLLYLAAVIARLTVISSPSARWDIYLLGTCIFVVQLVLGVWAAVSVLRAFVHLIAQVQQGTPPAIER